MSCCIFTIDTTVWESQPTKLYPVTNSEGSFSDLTMLYYETEENITTVTISWSSYTSSQIDGIVFNDSLAYFKHPSFHIETPISELIEIFTREQIIKIGYTSSQLQRNGFTILELMDHYTPDDILKGGYTLPELIQYIDFQISYKNVLFVDKKVRDVDVFLDACNEDTIPILYDTMNTRDEILSILQHITEIQRVAFVFDKTPMYTFLNNEMLFESGEPNTNTEFLVDMITRLQIKNIDFLACDTLRDIEWKDFYDVLAEKTGVIVGASDDKTGNIKYGGDWVLESTNTDIESVYFTKTIEYYKYLLGVYDNNFIYKNGQICIFGENPFNVISSILIPIGKIPKTISCSGNDTMVLMTDGTIYGCGDNVYGQLGDGTTTQRTTLTLMPNSTGKTPKSISCGELHTIVTMTDGTIYGCGGNSFNQLGDGTSTQRTTLTLMTNSTGKIVSNISCGQYHTIVLMTDGTIYGCGYNVYNQLGDGTTVNKSTLTLMTNTTGKTPKSINCGYTYTMVTMTDGTIYGCGRNNYGQLGDGTSTQRTTLTLMTNSTGKIPSAISCGEFHTMVLMTDGTIYGCGRNISAQLGDGTTTQKTTLTLMTNSTGKIPKSISCGTEHTTVFMTDGTIYGCGSNTSGQLGDGTTVNKSTLTLMTITTEKTLSNISCGSNHTMVLMTDGTIYGCGYNLYGQLGNGKFKALIDIPTGKTFNSGFINGSSCILLMTDGTVYGCGDNVYGQLGNGTTVNKSTLTLMIIPTGKTVSNISWGQLNIIVIMTDGTIYGCGANYYSELGDGTTTQRTTLTLMTNSTGKTPKSISCGEFHTMVLMTDGTIYGCGKNNYGQLVDGTTTQRTTLTLMTNSTGKTPKSISCGSNHTMVLMTDGTIYGCGNNGNGQLGDGTTTQRTTLTLMTNTTGKTPSNISCGSSYTMVIMTDGTIYGCGLNTSGQLGDGTTTQKTILTLMTNTTGKIVSNISCGTSSTTIFMTDGTVYVCGSNSVTVIGGTLVNKLTLSQNIIIMKLYRSTELKTSGYTETELKAGGYTATELKEATYTATELKAGGYTVTELKAGGYTATELKAANYTATELKAFNYIVSELKTAGFTALELKNAEYTAGELFVGGFTSDEIKILGYTDFKSSPFSSTVYIYKSEKTYIYGDSSYQVILGQVQLKLDIPSGKMYNLSSVGSNHIIVLMTDGTIYGHGLNTRGQLGDGTTTNKSTLTLMTNTTGKTVSAISCGSIHTIVLMTDGTIYGCGYNPYGQLGDGTTTQRTTLTLMTNSTGKTPKSISCGQYHTMVLMTDGTIYGCGYNSDYSQLGDGTTVNKSTLTLMTNSTGKIPKTISCGDYYTIVLMTDGTIYGCGYNQSGQLGNGTTVNKSTLTLMTNTTGKIPKSISCGVNNTIVMMTDGIIYGCGSNYNGQLGNGSTMQRSTLTLMTNTTGKTPKSISCGQYDTMVLMTDGTIYGCGLNISGELGDGTTTQRTTLVKNVLIESIITALDYKLQGYTATQLKSMSFTARELKAAVYTATELKAANYTLIELKAGGYTATELKEANYTLTELKAVGYTAIELKAAVYTATELKTAGYTATELKAGGYTATELKAVNYTLTELKAVNYTATDLKTAGFTALELKNVEFTAGELFVAGFTADEIKILGYTDFKSSPLSSMVNIYKNEKIYIYGDSRTQIKKLLQNITNTTGKIPSNISCGQYHTMVIMTDGTIYGCGINTNGQLGDGTTTQRSTLTLMTNSTGKTPKTISCGSFHTMVLMTDGTIYGCGHNGNGQLGDGTLTHRSTLTLMTNSTGKIVSNISCGQSHTMVLMTDGTIYGCGNNGNGQLGDGTTTQRTTLTLMTNSTGKTPKTISCGGIHTMVLMTDGTIYGCGHNGNGQLGDGTTINKSTLTLMPNSTGKIRSNISCGQYHTMVIMTDGTIYGCGNNGNGQLGDGTTTQKTTLTLMTNSTGKIPKSISCGSNHTMVLMTDGTIYDCGYNTSGQLGDGTLTQRTTLTLMTNTTGKIPNTISCGSDHTIVLMTDGTIYGCGLNNSDQFGIDQIQDILDIPVSKIYNLSSIGNTYTMVLMADGTIYGYGTNYYGQLGDGTTIDKSALTLMTNSTGKTPKTISCGQSHTIVLMTDGTIYGCGYNTSAQLGDGTYTNKSTLTLMTNSTGKTPKSISCGQYHTIVFMTNGTIYGCGKNDYSQLGDGTTVNKSTLTLMTNSTGKTPKTISCGSDHIIVLMTDGTIYGCGYNGYNQLGDGTTVNKSTLTLMTNTTGKTVSNINCGYNHTMVLMTDGTIYGCGINTYGQLGDGTTTQKTTLTLMTNSTGKIPKSISCGTEHTTVFMTDGTIYGCGSNTSGQLGDGTRTNRLTLVQNIVVDSLVSASDYKSQGYTATQLKSMGFTITQLKTAGYTTTELKTAGYTGTELKTAGYTGTELKTAGYTATELKTAGYTTTELKTAGYTATELKTAGYTTTELKTANYTISDLYTSGFQPIDLSGAFTTTEIVSVGYSTTTLYQSGYQISDLSGVYTRQQIASAGYSLATLYTSGFAPLDLSGTFTTLQIVQAGYQPSTLYNNGFTPIDLRGTFTIQQIVQAGYQPTTLYTSGFTIQDLSGTFQPNQIAKAGYPLITLFNNNFTPLDLSGAFPAKEIAKVGYPLETLYQSNFTILDLSGAFPAQEISKAGYSLPALYDNGFTPLDLSGAFPKSEILSFNYSASQLYTGGFTVTDIINTFTRPEIIQAGFPPSTLFANNFTITDLSGTFPAKEIAKAGYPLETLYQSNFTILDLSGAFPAQEISKAGYSLTALYDNGFTPLDLSGAFPKSEILSLDYSAAQLYTGGFTVTDIVSTFTPQEIIQAGFPPSTLFANNFTITDLSGSFTPNEIAKAGYPLETLYQSNFTILDLSGAFPTQQIAKAGYSLTTLYDNGFTPLDLSGAFTKPEILAFDYSATELYTGGFTVTDIINTFTRPEIVQAGFPPSTLFVNNFTITDLSGSFTPNEIAKAGYPLETLYQSNFTPLDLSGAFTTQQIVQVGYEPPILFNYNFTPLDLSGTFTRQEIAVAGYSAPILYDYQFTPFDLSGTFTQGQVATLGYTASVLKGAEYSAIVLQNAQYTSNQLQLGGYSPYDLSGVYTRQQIELAGYLASTLREAGYSPIDLVEEYSKSELLRAGYSSATLFSAGYSVQDLSGIYTPVQIASAGYTITQLKTEGYSLTVLKDAGFTPSQLTTASYSTSEILSTGYPASTLLSSNYPASMLLLYGYTPQQLYIGGYPTTQMKKAGFTPNVLLQLGYSMVDISGGGYTVVECKESNVPLSTLLTTYTTSALLAGGYTVVECKESNVTATTLYTNGVSISSLVSAGYTLTNLLAIPLTLAQLKSSGIQKAFYNVNNTTITQLITAGYTPADLYIAGYSISELISANTTLGQLRLSGFKQADYTSVGYTIDNLKTAGYVKADYIAAGYSANTLVQSGLYTVTTLIETLGYSFMDILNGGIQYPGFIFEINTSDWNSTYPIRNTGGSFTGLSYSFTSYSTEKTIVRITWNSYTNLNVNDGLDFYNLVNYFYNPSLNILQFGGIPLPNMNIYWQGSFKDFAGEILATDVPTLPNKELNSCFDSSTTTVFGNINNWDVSGITDFEFCFFNIIGNPYINDWNMKNALHLGNMFSYAINFDQPLDKWNVSNVQNMERMFVYTYKFNQPLNSWNVSNVTSFYEFLNSANLFNQPLNNWNISSVDNMVRMFYNATSFNQDISSWNTSNVTNMNSMFSGATAFNKNIGGWNFSKVTSLSSMLSNTGYNPLQVSNLLQSLYNNSTFVSKNIGSIPNYFGYTGISTIYSQLKTAPKSNSLTSTETIPNISTFKSSKYSVQDLLQIGYTASQLLTSPSTYTLSDFSNTTIQSSQYTALGYTLANVISAGFSIQTISSIGYSINDVLAEGFYLPYLATSNYTKSQYTAAGITVDDLIQANYTGGVITQLGYTFSEVIAANYSITQIIQLGSSGILLLDSFNINKTDYTNTNLTAADLKVAGFTATQLKKAGYSANDLYLVNYTAVQLYTANYTTNEVYTGGYSAANLFTSLYTPISMIAAGYTLSDMKAAGYTTTQLKVANVTTAQILSVGYSLTDIRISGYTAQQLKTENISISQMVGAGYIASNMYSASYTITELLPYYPLSDIVVAGYTIADFLVANISSSDLRTNGKTAQELKTGGYSLTQLVEGGYTPTQLKSVNYTAQQLDVHFTLAELISTPFIPLEIRLLNYTITDQITNGYQLVDLSNAGYVKSDFVTESITIQQLKTAGYKSTNYTTIGYSLLDLYNSGAYTGDELIEIGYTINDMFYTNIPISGLIYDLSAGLFDNTIPVKNTGNSFTGLTYRTSSTATVTTVNVTWTSYTNKSPLDGFSIRDLTYGINNSFTILQFGGIPLENGRVDWPAYGAFEYFAGSILATDVPKVVNNSLSHYFIGSTCTKYGNINNWDVSGITDTYNTFANSNFNTDISGWNISNITNMRGMFSGSVFNKPIGNWNVSKVTNMNSIFYNNKVFNQPLNNWNVGNVTSMDAIFQDTLEFNQPLNNWDIGKVTNMNGMFTRTTKFNQDISMWNTSNVTSMSAMFYESAFNNSINNWNTSKVTLMNDTFLGSSYQRRLDNWDVGNVTTMYRMFNNSKFNQDISGWNVSKVTDMLQMFSLTKYFNSPIGKWNVSNVTTMKQMFYDSNFNQPIGYWNTTKVTDMDTMFHLSLFNQDISGWNVSNVTTMESMFYDSKFQNVNIAKWNFSPTVNITNFINGSAFTPIQMNILLSEMSKNTILRTKNFSSVPKYAVNSGITTVLSLFQNATLYIAGSNEVITSFNSSNYSISELLSASYSLSEIVTAKYVKNDYINASITIQQFKTANISPVKLKPIGYTLSELLNNGYTLSDMRESGFQKAEYIIASITISQLKTAGFSILELQNAGYNASEVVDTGYTLVDLSNSGFQKSQYTTIGYTIGNLKNTGYTKANYILAGYTPADLINSGIYKLNDLLNIGYTYADIIPSGNFLPGFIFDISSSVFTTLTNTKKSLVKNTSNTFSDLSYSFVTTPATGLTTVFVTWSSYLFNSYNSYKDGLHVRDNVGDKEVNASVNILQFGNIPIAGTESYGSFTFFYGSITANDTPILPTSPNLLFYYSKCKTYGNIAKWDTSNVTNMNGMFEGSNFNVDISGWNVSNVNSFITMFKSSSFNQPINDWNVSKSTSFYEMFASSQFNQPLYKWNVAKCSNFTSMFIYSIFNQDISTWNFSKGSNVQNMLLINAIAVSNRNIGAFNFSQLTNVSTMTTYSGYNSLRAAALLVTLSKNTTFLKLNLTNIWKVFNQYGWQTYLSYLSTPTSDAAYNIIKSKLIGTPVIESPLTFKNSGYSTYDLRIVGYTIQQLLLSSAIGGPGYTLYDLSNSGFQKTNYAAVPYTISDLSNAGFSADNLGSAGYSFSEIIQAGFPLSKFASSQVFNKKSYYTAYTVNQLITTGFSLLTLSNAGYTKTDFKNAQYTPVMLAAAGFSIPIFKTAGYTPQEIVSGGYSLSQVKTYKFTKTEYTTSGYTIYDLKQSGFTKSDYTTAGYSPKDLLDSGVYTFSDLMNTLKYTYAELIPAGCMPDKRGFIFDVATSHFNNPLLLFNSGTKIPIKNVQNTFVDLSYSVINTISTGITTVFVTWSSYSSNVKTNGDGFTIGNPNIAYTLNILQYGGIPITHNATFQSYAGSISAMDTPTILTTSFQFLFWFSTCKSFGNIGAWDVSGVTNFYATFDSCTYFNSDIGNWNMSNATYLVSMFAGSNFNQDISRWNVSKVTHFDVMFYRLKNFNAPIGIWNTSSAVSFASMFKDTNFTQDISKWNTVNVTSINGIFQDVGTPVPNIGGWNFTKIKNVDNFITTPIDNNPDKILAITALFRSLSNNPTYCLGTDPTLPLLDISSVSDIIAKLAEKGYILVSSPVTVTISQLKEANCAVGDLRDVGFTVTELLSEGTEGFQLGELAGAGYTPTEFTSAGVSVTDLLTAGFSPTELITTGYSVASISLTDLIASSGFDYTFKALGYTIPQVIATGNPMSIFVNSDYISTDYIGANISISTLYTNGFSASKLLSIGFQSSDLLAIPLPFSSIKETSITLQQIVASNMYALADLSNGLYTQAQFTSVNISLVSLKTAGYTVEQLLVAGYSATQLYQVGYTPALLIAAGISISSLYLANVLVSQLTAINVTASELYMGGYPLSSLLSANISLADIISAGYDIVDISNSGVTVSQMKTAGVILDTFIQYGFDIVVLKENGYTATQFKNIGYNSLVLKNTGYSLSELTLAGYSAANLLLDGFTPQQMKDNGFSAKQLADENVPLETLYDISFGIPQLVLAGFSLSSLKTVGFSATQFYNASYTAAQVYSLSYTIPEMKVAGYTAGEMLGGNINASLLKINGYTAGDFKTTSSLTITQLNLLGYTAIEMRAAGYLAAELLNGNVYTVTQLKAGFYTAAEMKVANVTVADMRTAGYTANQLHIANYTAAELYSGGYTVQQLFVANYILPDLKTIGVPIADIISGGYTLQQVFDAGYEVTQLISFNYTASQLKQVGYSATQLKAANYTSIELFSAAYTASQLFVAGYSATDLNVGGYRAFQARQAGYSLSQLKTGNYTVPQLQEANYTATDMKTAGFTAGNLIGYYSGSDMKVAGFTTADLFTGGFSASSVFTANYPVSEMRTSGYSLTDIKAAGATISQSYTGGFTGTELKTVGYTATELKSVGFTLVQMYNLGYSASETSAAEYSIGELYSSGYTVLQLKDAGFTIPQLKSIGISDAKILEAGFTKEELLAAGMQFSLDRFSSSNIMTTIAAAWEGIEIENLKPYDATAVFYMSQETIQKIFSIKLQGNLMDMENLEITYFTHMQHWPTGLVLNPSNGMLGESGSSGSLFQANTSNKMLVKHDFVRYLALKLFGSVQGVDIFNNESMLIQSLNNMGNNTFNQDISAVLWNYSSTNPRPNLNSTYIYDPSFNYYTTTDELVTNDNICRELCQQLLFENVDRFSLLTKNSDGLYPIPILSGDSISFTYTILPSEGQHLLTDVDPIPERTYKILIIIDDGTGINTIPVD